MSVQKYVHVCVCLYVHEKDLGTARAHSALSPPACPFLEVYDDRLDIATQEGGFALPAVSGGPIMKMFLEKVKKEMKGCPPTLIHTCLAQQTHPGEEQKARGLSSHLEA